MRGGEEEGARGEDSEVGDKGFPRCHAKIQVRCRRASAVTVSLGTSPHDHMPSTKPMNRWALYPSTCYLLLAVISQVAHFQSEVGSRVAVSIMAPNEGHIHIFLTTYILVFAAHEPQLRIRSRSRRRSHALAMHAPCFVTWRLKEVKRVAV